MLLALLQQAASDQQPLRLFGVPLVGFTTATGHKLLLSLGFIVVILALSWGIKQIVRRVARPERHARARFWTHQATSVLFVVILIIGLVSIWFEDPARLTTVLGVVTAGVAIALQRVITAFAAYLIILRGRIFAVGDRITMGGVRGDVIALGFMQTTVMEMGESPDEQGDAPSMWVHARQYTGRMVRVTNDKIFDTPVYNFTREFPYFWDEIRIPIAYRDDRRGAEGILLQVAERHTREVVTEAKAALVRLRQRYVLPGATDPEPRVYHRLTDNWVELSLRFIAPVHGVRVLKDAMSREILAALDEKKIGIASSTFEVVGLPPLRIVGDGGGTGHPTSADLH